MLTPWRDKAAPTRLESTNVIAPRQLRALVGRELEVDRGQALVQLGDRRGADQRDRRDLASDQPGQYHLVDGRPGLLGHVPERCQPSGGARMVELDTQRLSGRT